MQMSIILSITEFLIKNFFENNFETNDTNITELEALILLMSAKFQMS
jgi:hypothetical protein